MPKDKDFKLIVRDRMARTGESYSIARMRVLAGVANGANGSDGHAGRPVGFAVPTTAEAIGAAIYSVKITVAEITPEIWRRVLVPAETTLAQLHRIIQAVCGWEDYHLHQFTANGQRYAMPCPELADEMVPALDERPVTLRELLWQGAKSFIYEYDLGDSWEHRIEIERVDVVAEAGIAYPTCVAGARACPPEDCGGVSGYDELVQALRDPEHPEHEEKVTWSSGMERRKYDPERFELERANKKMKRLQKKPGAKKAGGDARP